jgi:methionyl-tRNA formyltransferase
MNREIVFFGNERLASGCTTNLPILNSLLGSDHKIKLIVISEKGTKSRSKRKLEVENFAKRNSIELFIPKNNEELISKLKSLNAHIGILAAYGKIIPQKAIDLFPKGIINLHPSLLPKYRGPTPIESAILNGDEKTGVSIMSLTAGMDSGPIYSQIELKLSGKESKQELVEKLGDVGSKEIMKLLSAELAEPKKQVGSAEFCNLITKKDSILDLSIGAKKLERQIRAYLGWPGSKLRLSLATGEELEVIVTEAKVISYIGNQPEQVLIKDQRFFIKTSEDYLEIIKLKLPGKNEISAKDFINGYARIIEPIYPIAQKNRA